MRRNTLAAMTIICGVVAASTVPVPVGQAATEPNVVTDWVTIVEPAVHNADAPRPPGGSFIVHTVAHLAVYDAVMAIEGGHEPFGPAIDAPDGADVRAAVATAAYRAAVGRVAESQHEALEARYREYMEAIPDGAAESDGIEVGEAAASGILALRADDGYDRMVDYQCSEDPPPVGEFEPDGGCGVPPIDPKLAQVKPFTFPDPAQFRPDGPAPFDSEAWARDFEEVKSLGRADSTVRTAEQTDVAYFWSEHAYVHWNRALTGLASSRDLDVAETARLFAMVSTTASDAVIAGFDAKYHFRTWRPRTAIPRAAEDGNPATEPDPDWKPLLSVNHPEYPSGHSFVSGALTRAVAAFFGSDDVEWTIETSKEAVPKLVKTERTYKNLPAIVDEIAEARIVGGLHYRQSMTDGAALGGRVAEHVLGSRFAPVGDS